MESHDGTGFGLDGQIRILRGCLLNDEAMVRSGFERLWRKYSCPIGKEGIQADWSFHQHGNVSTPEATARSLPRIWRTWPLAQRGLPLPSQACRNILSSYILDGQQWMVRGRVWDYGVVGREITGPARTRGG